MKFKNNIKRGAILLLALLLASASSFAVYAAVNYNSANDPVVSFSGMVAYVNDILEGIRSSIKELDLRMTLLEAGGYTPGTSTGGTVSSGMLKDLLDRIESLEKRVGDLETDNASLRTELANTKNELGRVGKIGTELDGFDIILRAEPGHLSFCILPCGDYQPFASVGKRHLTTNVAEHFFVSDRLRGGRIFLKNAHFE